MITTEERTELLKDARKPPAPPVSLEDWEADRERRAAERAKKEPELARCLDPRYAAAREMEKAVFRYRVRAEWLGQGDDGMQAMHDGDVVVLAQSESDAWAGFCDKLQTWPSRRGAKVTFENLGQVALAEAAASRDSHDPVPAELPRISHAPRPRAVRL